MKSLLRFLLRYLAVTLVASAAVWFGVGFIPPAKAYAARTKVESLRQTKLSGAFTVVDAVTKMLDRCSSMRLPDVATLLRPKDQDAGAGFSIKSPAYAESGNAQWGVVNSAFARAYNRQGKFLRRLDPGTVVDISQTVSTKEGPIAICDVYYQGKRVPGVAIKAEDLLVRDGTLSKVPDQLRTLLVRQAELEGRITALKHKLGTGLREDNPHAGRYAKATREFNTFSDKVRALKQRFASATGDERNKLTTELREMRAPSFQLQREYQAAKEAYDAWNRQNPPDETGNVALIKLEGDLALLKKRIAKTAGQE